MFYVDGPPAIHHNARRAILDRLPPHAAGVTRFGMDHGQGLLSEPFDSATFVGLSQSAVAV